MANSRRTLSRRDILKGGAAAGLGLVVPWNDALPAMLTRLRSAPEWLEQSAAGSTESKAINQFNPASGSSIVVNMREFPAGVDAFSNYRNWKTDSGVLHNTVPKVTRQVGDIKFIVLHETSEHTGKGFRPPENAHFSVLKDGSILQFNDLAEIEWHAGIFNDAGVGIEFVNRDWEDGRGVRKSAVPLNLAEDKGYLWAFWGDGYSIYKLPSVDQLESLSEFVRRLVQKLDDGFPSVEHTWLQFVSYNDIKDLWEFVDEADVPTSEPGKAVKKFFIYSNAYSYMVPRRFKDFESGILSHNCISNIQSNGYTDENAHTDGSFPALYTWLRIIRDLPKDEAFDQAKDLFKNHLVKARTRTALKWKEKTKDGSMVEQTGKRLIYLLYVDDAM